MAFNAINVCLYVYMYILRIFVCMYVHTIYYVQRIFVCIYVHTTTHACMHTYIHTYQHTHTYVYRRCIYRDNIIYVYVSIA